MKCINFALAQAAATIAAAAVGIQALPFGNMHHKSWRDPVQHLFGNGLHSVSVDMGANWEPAGLVNPRNTPPGTMWEFLYRPSEQHLFRDGRHLISYDRGATWLFFRCELDPFTRQGEMMQSWDMGVLPIAGFDNQGEPRVSCDGGVTWE
ncbi:hypothetical protein THASP1DRAFT_33452 [Thamnocephalis sphaerospora]|uniref:Uncharacterized protein n=1 Tax=Thamnocephalis sphaerospora TaxID=78915 RepID=A0A4P9XGI7_9FUNG|nr:hypothetical protein THASP1DRAFT_33452 [Thamnocephalis sphaerospora]|eukprot:RKP04744.1 hypothetical protein THASP1DRAFT_33452 [Thamnocephalis sphaerospora]